jgi:peptide-methionine (S)-S-oxide reductase
MTKPVKLIFILMIAIFAACGIVSSSNQRPAAAAIEPPSVDPIETEPQKDTEVAVFAGGCFWGVEGVFEHVKGVRDVKSGYAGGTARSANYDAVSSGRTDHAESVRVTYDPTKVSYAQLLNVFFSVAHDPTQLNRQGPDVGRHYRSAIFYIGEAQRAAAHAYIDSLNRSGTLSKPIVTEVVPLQKFYNAEPFHQDFMKKNPTQPYIVEHDKPKLEDLKAKFPELYFKKW